jgi:hypothetical protein
MMTILWVSLKHKFGLVDKRVPEGENPKIVLK